MDKLYKCFVGCFCKEVAAIKIIFQCIQNVLHIHYIIMLRFQEAICMLKIEIQRNCVGTIMPNL